MQVPPRNLLTLFELRDWGSDEIFFFLVSREWLSEWWNIVSCCGEFSIYLNNYYADFSIYLKLVVGIGRWLDAFGPTMQLFVETAPIIDLLVQVLNLLAS